MDKMTRQVCRIHSPVAASVAPYTAVKLIPVAVRKVARSAVRENPVILRSESRTDFLMGELFLSEEDAADDRAMGAGRDDDDDDDNGNELLRILVGIVVATGGAKHDTCSSRKERRTIRPCISLLERGGRAVIIDVLFYSQVFQKMEI